jgi:predicted ATPase
VGDRKAPVIDPEPFTIRWAVAEVLRIKAGLLQATGRATADEIEGLLIKSLETGRRQQALSWQLRTACDLVRLWQGQGRDDEALTLLQSIYDQFTEGFGRRLRLCRTHS